MTRRATDRYRIAAATATGIVAWGLFESQWVRHVQSRALVAGLEPGFAGLRVAHVSDLHVGAPGLNGRALRRAVDLVVDAAPDIVCISGDVRARVGGDRLLRRQLARLEAPLGSYAVLGNHDIGEGHDPFGDGVPLGDLDGTPVRLLADDRVVVHHPAGPIVIGGLAPQSDHLEPSRGPGLRILVCHYPTVLDRLRPGEWHVVLAGHLHGGQICIPLPTGKVRLAHASRSYLEGLYGRDGTVMHISRGVGTTFVPFRFAARPEVTILELATMVAA
jgi:predicted MPP superfamily phosphohydrolase